jgi:hypothetical protein
MTSWLKCEEQFAGTTEEFEECEEAFAPCRSTG